MKQEDPEREDRIIMEIVVDAHDSDERRMGWHCYLEDQLHFPFTARCSVKRSVSPLRLKQQVKVLGMADEDECGSEMFVEIEWQNDRLAVPLSQLEAVKADEETRQAIDDWRYWVEMHYQF